MMEMPLPCATVGQGYQLLKLMEQPIRSTSQRLNAIVNSIMTLKSYDAAKKEFEDCSMIIKEHRRYMNEEVQYAYGT